MYSVALDTKIRTEAERMGYANYIIQEDLVPLKGDPNSGVIRNEPSDVNTPNLCIYFNPVVKFLGVSVIPVPRSLSVTGSIENKVVDTSLAKMEVEHKTQITVPLVQDVYFTRHSIPFMTAAVGLVEIKWTYQAHNIGAVTGYIRRIQIIPYTPKFKVK